MARTRRRWTRLARLPLCILTVAGGLDLLLAPVARPASADTSSCTVPASVTATPDTTLDGAFTQYGNAGTGWTGGDDPRSVSLPDGRTLWFFSDTYLGRVGSTGMRNLRFTPYIHNSVVEQAIDGTLDATLINTSPRGKPLAFVAPVRPSQQFVYGYWPGASVVIGNSLYVVMGEYKFRQRAFQFTFMGNAIATYSLPDLTLQTVTKLPLATIDWSQSILVDPSGLYVYGFSKGQAYVATTNPTDPTTGWQYYDGTGWTTDQTQAAAIASVGGGFSVTRQGDAYVLVGMPYLDLFSGTIGVSYSCSPTGGFGPLASVYSAPEPQQYPSTFGIITYDAHAQLGVSAGTDSLEISYDVNAPGKKPAMSTASVYRPRYVTLTFGY